MSGIVGHVGLLLKRSSDGGTDPYWGNVAALLHFDGANGSTVFTDQKGRTYTATGSAALQTARSKFGGSSLGNGGTGTPYVSTPSDPSMNIGFSDFTAEMWLYVPSAITSMIGLLFYVVGGGLEVTIETTNRVRVRSRNVVTHATSTVDFPRDQWVHLAISRTSGVMTIFQNGVNVGSGTSSNSFGVGAVQLMAVSSSNWYLLGGNMDEFRLTIGVGRYTSNFTPPTAPFPNS